MAKNTASVAPATAADVRTWALAQDSFSHNGVTIERSAVPALNQGDSVRGRLPRIVTAAYDAAHPDQAYRAGGKVTVRTVKVPTVSAKGRKSARLAKGTPAEFRAAAVAAGLTVNAKGRLTNDQMVAAGAQMLGITLPTE